MASSEQARWGAAVWEASLDAVRKNASAVQEANVKWFESMMELAPKGKAAPASKSKAA